MIAFDLETSKILDEGAVLMENRPLGISCAALRYDDGRSQVFHGGMGVKEYAPCLTVHDCRRLVSIMLNEQRSGGNRIVSFNGLGFDFDILAEECQDPFFKSYNGPSRDACKELALGHIDIGFQMYRERGFMIGLDAMAHALGLPGKMEEVGGAKAPEMWAQGKFQQEKVLEYVAQDVVTTLDVYWEIIKQGEVKWITKAGRPAKYPWVPQTKDGRLLTVQECLELPDPDTSWMDEPWPLEKFTGWLDV
jgi:hypothetical protein